MRRFRITHNTYYNFSGSVILGTHYLRLRPREGHTLHIESSTLTITPQPTLRWRHDVEGNSVAIASFSQPTSQLSILSDIIIQQYNEDPLDFVVEQQAVDYPFLYEEDDRVLLQPYMTDPPIESYKWLTDWIGAIWQPGEAIQTYTLMQRICSHIYQTFAYRIREEPGVQSAEQTIALKAGSCRDFAQLFMSAARHLGLAARFVSGYLHAPPTIDNFGATHAWAEIYVPGAGWVGFDPTIGQLVGADHIAVAVARLPESVPPVSGTFSGAASSVLDVGVWINECHD